MKRLSALLPSLLLFLSVQADVAAQLRCGIQLLSPAPLFEGGFGHPLAFTGDQLLVGAMPDESSTVRFGIVYVYELTDGAWQLVQQLDAMDESVISFGWEFAAEEDHALFASARGLYAYEREAGRWHRRERVTLPVDGPQGIRSIVMRDSIALVGAAGLPGSDHVQSRMVYVYEREGARWVLRDTLQAWDDSAAAFAAQIVLTPHYAAVSDERNDERGEDAGAVYIFRRDGLHFGPDVKLTASDARPFDQFGRTMAGDSAALIIHSYSGGTTYVFEHANQQWHERGVIRGRDETKPFIESISLSDDYVILGGDVGEDGLGRSYLHARSAFDWALLGEIVQPPFPSRYLFPSASSFGYATALSGPYLAIGAPWDDTEQEEEAGFVCLYHLGGLAADGNEKLRRETPTVLRPYPNPFASETTITYTLTAPGNVALQIYDVQGREVRSFDEGYRLAGDHLRTWDGRDGTGRLLSGGVYLCRLRGSAGSAVVTVILMR